MGMIFNRKQLVQLIDILDVTQTEEVHFPNAVSPSRVDDLKDYIFEVWRHEPINTANLKIIATFNHYPNNCEVK